MVEIKLFVDLDGTVADFNNVPNALERYDKELGFFKRLKPFKDTQAINELAKVVEVYIISASPNLIADIDKRYWVRNNLPNVKSNNILLCRNGQNKAVQVKRQLKINNLSKCYLLDDYTKNLHEWTASGGIGIKRLTKDADNSTKKWQGLEVENLFKLLEVIQ